MEFKNQYLTYQEYEKLNGQLQEMPFNLLELEARANIDKYTFGRLKELPTQIDEVKLCVLHLIELLDSYKSMQEHDKSISSVTTNGYSESYNTDTQTALKGKIKEIKAIIYTDLADTPYLYRGV